MPDRLDAGSVRRWCAATLAALRREQREIDALNFFPVADSDTGTNLVLTLQAAVEAVAANGQGESVRGESARGESARGVWKRMARGALLGARGNSGMIVSQLLAGAAAALPADEPVRGRALAASLRAAVAAGYAAVAQPVEGTVLSVADAAARGATAADSDDLAVVSAAALRAAALALESTPAQLAAMGLPGVVDAGGRGLVVMLDALDAVVRDDVPLLDALGAPPADPVNEQPALGAQEGWEIQYLLDVPLNGSTGDDHRIAALRTRLTEVGDSVVVACADPDDGGHAVWTVHVHAHDIGPALEAGLVAGRPHQVVVTPLIVTGGLDEHDHSGHSSGGDPDPSAARAVVAVVPGAGLAQLFAAEGAVPVEVAPGTFPTVGELRAAIERSGATEVVLLPNDGAYAAVAEAASAAADADCTVSVLHTRSPVQGIAALAVADGTRPFRNDVVAMAEAAAATRWAEVTVAEEAGLTVVGPCRAGDVLGLVDGDVVAIGADTERVTRDLVDRLLNAGGELVTVVLGSDAAPTLGDALSAHLRARWPFCEVHLFDGGQPRAVVLLGVE
ncbi:DAK2 domain-containing protein [Cryptosporangium minutisporangium]|uniref:DAK2 domain-containing protein n=1 Tax=Cryptosporangium minutisporangium TaxID=113569 RepID=A0ABP6T2Y5_9ACTN